MTGKNARLTTTIDWKIRLSHERANRDALVACGNPAPEKPDPPGGLIEVECRVFSGKKYWRSMNDAGHDSTLVQECCCFTKRPIKKAV